MSVTIVGVGATVLVRGPSLPAHVHAHAGDGGGTTAIGAAFACCFMSSFAKGVA